MPYISKLVKEVAENTGVKLAQIIQHESSAYFYVLSPQVGEQLFVKLDICGNYIRHGYLFLTAKWMLEGRIAQKRKGAKWFIAAPEKELAYYLFKKVEKGQASSAALTHLANQFTSDPIKCRSIILQYYPNSVETLQKIIINKDEFEFSKIVKDLHHQIHNKFLHRKPLLLLAELKRKLKRMIQPTGFIIAVLGPDGSGKSTLLKDLTLECAPLGRRNLNIHLFPPLKKIEDRGSPVTNPHAKPPHSFLLSVIKLGWLIARYNLGWIYSILIPYRSSTMIYFDRYYDDFLVDPLRYRMNAPACLVRFAGWFIPKPDIFLILDVSPEIARTRKKEVSVAESQRQFYAYRTLAGKLSNSFLVDANQAQHDVVEDCKKIVVEAMASRIAKRMRSL